MAGSRASRPSASHRRTSGPSGTSTSRASRPASIRPRKPVELFVRPIEFHTKPGDIVYEPFCGSGTQLIAAERTGRVCCAMEQEPLYVDIAVRRWEAFSGQKATRAKA